MKNYIVRQTFETIGDPCRKEFNSSKEAQAYAEQLKTDIAQMVADWQPPDPLDLKLITGVIKENAAWREVENKANGASRYGIEAGKYIAGLAVEIEEADEEE